ncbi:MAG: HD domain-containing protein [Planctomycetaceae bacterium]|jgi:tRNA nucleotidyltransferase (CCA-adding enzyme)|nr:HD domain-containing protein [Planctomycetaceae bacterium]
MPLQQTLLQNKKTQRIIELLEQGGATEVYFVGGAVRDYLLGERYFKDIDIEVFGLNYEEIIRILSPSFRVNLVGKSFGTVKVDQRIDVSIPRRESKLGIGHKGFQIMSDPSMTFADAARRRDFTINAIGMRRDGAIADPYRGVDDLRQKILRATSEAFDEDPLRVLRAMQFVSRFDFRADEKTITMCRSLKSEFSTLSAERIFGEWEKWASKSQIPSRGLRLLESTGWLECFPEIAALRGTKQHPLWHREGDALEHTAAVADAMAQIVIEKKYNDSSRLTLMFSALLHDVGKPLTLTEKEPGVWHSPKHADAGVPLAKAFLEKMRASERLIASILPLVREHQTHIFLPLHEQPTDAMVRRLAYRLTPANIKLWSELCEADMAGCDNDRNLCHAHSTQAWLDAARRLGVFDAPPQPLLLGRDLIELGVEPGPEMGEILRETFEAQLDGEFLRRDDAVNWLKNRVIKRK